tara:strand:+ start:2887 stop:3288 length:402 start_codon:yes stop_codon:yes gene_type:complete
MKLEVVFHQSLDDKSALSVDGIGYFARLTKGVKIVFDIDTSIIAIYNVWGNSHFPKEINLKQYEVFKEYGWAEGVRHIHMYNLNKEMISLKYQIQQEKATTKNSKRIKSLSNKLKKMQDELQKIITNQDRPSD